MMSVLLAVALTVSTVSLGWSIAEEGDDETAIYVLHVCFALYTFLISTRAVTQENVDDHSDLIIHVTILMSVAFSLLFSSAILPDSPPPVAELLYEDSVPLGLWYTLIVIYALVCVLACTTPLGPPLHYEPSDIYSEKTVQSITNTEEENVCGIMSTLLRLREMSSSDFSCSRCITLGYDAILVYNQGRLAGKRCCKPRHR